MGRSKDKLSEKQTMLLEPMLQVCVLVLACLTPLVSIEGSPDLGTSLLVALFWIGLLILWSIQKLLVKYEASLYWSNTETAVAALLIWLAISVVSISGEGALRPAINSYWDFVSFGIAYFLVRQTVRTVTQQKTYLLAFLGIAVLVSVYGLYQYQIELPATRAAYFKDPESVLVSLGVDPSPDSPQRKLYEGRLLSSEPAATFTLTNSLAGFLATWAIILATCVLSAVKAKNRWMVLSSLLLVGFVGACLIVTKSRTAWLALFSGLGLWFLYGIAWKHRVNWKIPLGIVVLGFLIFSGAFFSGALDTEVLSEAPKSILYRLQYWEGATEIVKQRPLFGCSPGNFRYFYPQFMSPAASETVSDPHNFLVELISIGGLPVLMILIFFGWSWVKQFLQAVQADDQSRTLDANDSKNTSEQKNYLLIAAGAVPVLGIVLRAILLEETLNPFILIGYPFVIFFFVCFKDWVNQTELPRRTMLIAIVAMLINLCAAGGISFPGVAISLWVLLAMSINYQQERPCLFKPKWLRMVPAGISVLLFVTCLQTAYYPSSNANRLVARANVAISLAQTSPNAFENYERLLVEATNADPYSEKHLMQLSALYVNSILQAGTQRSDLVQKWRQELAANVSEAMRRNPRSFAQHAAVSRWYIKLYRATGDVEMLEQYRLHSQAAVVLFPTRAGLQAEFAWALHLAGEDQQAATVAEEALRLDGLHDHSERKLGALKLADSENELRFSSQIPLPEVDSNAEQAMLSLRIDKEDAE